MGHLSGKITSPHKASHINHLQQKLNLLPKIPEGESVRVQSKTSSCALAASFFDQKAPCSHNLKKKKSPKANTVTYVIQDICHINHIHMYTRTHSKEQNWRAFHFY